jgi:hypothetical protein
LSDNTLGFTVVWLFCKGLLLLIIGVLFGLVLTLLLGLDGKFLILDCFLNISLIMLFGLLACFNFQIKVLFASPHTTHPISHLKTHIIISGIASIQNISANHSGFCLA